MKSLIDDMFRDLHQKQLEVDVLRERYDLTDIETKERILPKFWDRTIKPGCRIEMSMFPPPHLKKFKHVNPSVQGKLKAGIPPLGPPPSPPPPPGFQYELPFDFPAGPVSGTPASIPKLSTARKKNEFPSIEEVIDSARPVIQLIPKEVWEQEDVKLVESWMVTLKPESQKFSWQKAPAAQFFSQWEKPSILDIWSARLALSWLFWDWSLHTLDL